MRRSGLGLCAALLAGALCLPSGAGCAARGPAPALAAPPGASSVAGDGDWDDVKAAVAAALARTELVLVRIDESDQTRLAYALRTSRDDPAVLVVERLDPAGGADPVRLRADCSVGRFGDPAREREFLAIFLERLGQLRGVEIAPTGR